MPSSDRPLCEAAVLTVREAVLDALRRVGYRPLGEVDDADAWQWWEDDANWAIIVPQCDPLSLLLAGKTLSIAESLSRRWIAF